MTFAAHHKLASYSMVASALLAVALTGAAGPLAVIALLCVLLGSWFLDTARLLKAWPRHLSLIIAAAATAAAFYDYRLFTHSYPAAAIHLLLALSALKLITLKTNRDYIQLYFLSFGLLLGASLATVRIIFLIPCMLFVTAAVVTLVLFEIKQSSETSISGAVRPFVIPRKWRDSGFELFAGFPSKRTATVAVILAFFISIAAIPLFFLLPRAPLQRQYSPAEEPVLISGFSETVRLGAIGHILESDKLVMKIRTEGTLTPDLKWRGLALDYFDGRAWTCTRNGRSQLPVQGGYYKMQETAAGAAFLVQTVFLEPLSTDVVFGARQILAVSTDAGPLARDAEDNVYSLSPRTATTKYSVVSDATRPDPAFMAPQPTPDRMQATYLQVPALDPRIAALARRVTAQAKTPYAQAQTLESYLKTRYRYSLDLTGTPGNPDPLAAFLFDTRRGHCEYFATAMAVMLRQIHIPSRMVNGFRAGEYNPVSDHWTVRQRNAHSWVEAWFPPYGWVEFDPTPPDPRAQRSDWLQWVSAVSDAVDFWWSDTIVYYGLHRQLHLFRSGISVARTSFGSASGAAVDVGRKVKSIASGPALIPIVIGAILITTAFLVAGRMPIRRRLVRRHAPGDQGWAVTAYYSEALAILNKGGWARKKSDTPAEFTSQLSGEPFSETFSNLTAMYNRSRFGKVVLRHDSARARTLVGELRVSAGRAAKQKNRQHAGKTFLNHRGHREK